MANEKRLDLIDRAKVYELACVGCTRHGELPGECYHDEPCERLIFAFTVAAPVDAVEVVHARWVYNGRSDDYFCSNCYKQPISFRREMNCGVGELVEVCFSDYCPNCGAKMDGERKDNETD